MTEPNSRASLAVASPSPDGAPGAPRGAAPYVVLVGLFLAVLMGGMDALVVSTALPVIASSLHDAEGIVFVVGAYLIAMTVATPVFAKVSDLTGRRNVFLVGLGIFVVGSALAGLSQNLGELILFRGVQGFGGGGVFPVAIAMVAVMFPPESRARITGILSAAGGIAIVVGPLLGSYVVEVTTWRWVFYVNLPIGLAAFAVVALSAGALKPERRGTFDTVGALALTTWVSALLFALVQVSDSGWAWTDPRVVGLLVLAAVVGAAWIVWEFRSPDPLVPLRMLGRRVIGASGGVLFVSGVVLNGVITFLSVFVGIVVFHAGPQAAPHVRDMIYFFAIPLILAAGLSGQLLQYFDYRTLLTPALVVAGLAGLALSTVAATTPLWTVQFRLLLVGGLALPLIPLGAGLGLAFAGTTVAVQNDAPPEEVGAAIGMIRFLQSLGGALGLSLLSVFQTWRYGALSAGATTPAAVLRATVSSYDDVFLAIAGVVFVGAVFASLLVGRVPRSTKPQPVSGGSPPQGPLPAAVSGVTQAPP